MKMRQNQLKFLMVLSRKYFISLSIMFLFQFHCCSLQSKNFDLDVAESKNVQFFMNFSI